MTNSSDRLDRIEALLERFIEASVVDARTSNERMTRIEQSMTASDQRMTRIEQSMTASDQRMTRIEQSMTASDQRMTRLEQTMERQNQESNERMKATDERLVQLSEKTDARFNQLVDEADANRDVTFDMLNQLTILQEESKQILEYLFGQQRRNGSSDQPQQ